MWTLIFHQCCITFLLITFGQQSISGGLASILNANTSFIAIILASLFLPLERLSLNRVVGVSIGILGVVIVVRLGDFCGLFLTVQV